MPRTLLPRLLVFAGWILYALSLFSPAIGADVNPAVRGREFLFGAECLQGTIVCFVGGVISITHGEATIEGLCWLTYLPANVFMVYSFVFYLLDSRVAKVTGGIVLTLSCLAALTPLWCEGFDVPLFAGYYLWVASFAFVGVGLFTMKPPGCVTNGTCG